MDEYLKVLLLQTIEHNSKDLYLTVDRIPSVRIIDQYPLLQAVKLSEQKMKSIISFLLDSRAKTCLSRFGYATSIYNEPAIGILRVKIVITQESSSLSICILPCQPPDLRKTSFPILLNDHSKQIFSEQRAGVLFISGKRGCGLTTTMASILGYLNQRYTCSIISIEDHIIYRFKADKSFITQVELTDKPDLKQVYSFASNYDVIFFNNINSQEKVIQLYDLAKATNSLIIASIYEHKETDLIEFLIEHSSHNRVTSESYIADWFLGIINQTDVSSRVGDQIKVYQSVIGVPAIRALIREDKFHGQFYGQIQVGGKYGMNTRDSSLLSLLKANIISKFEAKKHVTERHFFKLI